MDFSLTTMIESMKFAVFFFSLLVLSFALPIAAQTKGRPMEQPLWPDQPPGGRAAELAEVWTERPIDDGTQVKLDRSVKDISHPTMTVYLPAKPNSTRSSIVILPGGGFTHLAIDKEGHDIARWLNSQGIAGIVVKYRVYHAENQYYVSQTAIPDTLRAIRMVRHQATKWNLNPDKIGAMGFSAGGYLTAASGTMFDRKFGGVEDAIQKLSCRPDFIAPIYPLTNLEDRVASKPQFMERMLGPNSTPSQVTAFSPLDNVTADTPPTFLVHAHDDNLSSSNSAKFYLALLEAGVSTELHIYSSGGHGYGIRQRGLPISSWRGQFLEWLTANGFLD